METVTIMKYQGSMEILRQGINLCNGFKNLSPSHSVLIKPNLVVGGGKIKDFPKFGMVTTTNLIEQTIILLKEFGCNNITIGEGPAVCKELDVDVWGIYKWLEIDKLAVKYDIKLIDLNNDSTQVFKIDGVEIKIATSVLESDFLINMPVLKTHTMTKISMCMKNLKGCIPTKSKKKFHNHDLEKFIAHLNTFITPDLNIVDGIYSMEFGPTAMGTAHLLNTILVGTDSASCDAVGAEILGINPLDVEHLQIFSEMNVKPIDVNQINIEGAPLEMVKNPLGWERKKIAVFENAGMKGVTFQYPGKSWCTGCITNVYGMLGAYCDDNRGLRLDGVEFCSAKDVVPLPESKKVFLLGNCSIHKNKDLPNTIQIAGCPPSMKDLFVTVTKETLGERRAKIAMLKRVIKTIAGNLGFIKNKAIQKHYDSKLFKEKHFQLLEGQSIQK